jgi:Protein of unknown function (DUF3775)
MERGTAMDIALDKVCGIIERARAIDMKEGDADPASGSNPIDDANLDTLVTNPDDATEEELREMIAGLNEDERHDLIALVYIGRGDLESEEWVEAVRLAREREDASSVSTADWLLGIPNLGDLLDEGLAATGRSCTE